MPEIPDVPALAELCAHIIGVPSVDPADAFHDSGGDSVSAAYLAVLLDQRWGVSLDIFTIVAADSLYEIHQALTAAAEAAQSSGQPR